MSFIVLLSMYQNLESSRSEKHCEDLSLLHAIT